MTDRETWLSTIRSNPSDWQTMLVFADWLEDTEGDLLAAEQWRWIAVVSGSLAEMHAQVPLITRRWPDYKPKAPAMFSREKRFAADHNIRCMPRYPLTIEDVQAYLETAR